MLDTRRIREDPEAVRIPVEAWIQRDVAVELFQLTPVPADVYSAEQIELEFVPWTLQLLKHDDAYVGLPTDVQLILLFYNNELFREAGLPDGVLNVVNGDKEAVDAILDASQRVPDLWLVAVGPLTNVALALRLDPGLAERLAGISIMGGNWGPGNVSPVAEFNIWADPDAADEVFRSGANLVLAGLDLTHQFMIDDARRGAVRALGTSLATFGADLLDFFSHAYARTFGVPAEGPLHDPCAVLAVTDPRLFTTSRRHVEVETASDLTRGMTVVDQLDVTHDTNNRDTWAALATTGPS